MPSKPHPCAHPGCPAMLPRKESTHCKRHVPRSTEWIERVAASNRGRKRTPGQRLALSLLRSGVKTKDARAAQATRECEFCHTAFLVDKLSRRQRFCSRSCGYANRRGPRAPNWDPSIPTYPCEVCGAPMRMKAHGVRRYACSWRCNMRRRELKPRPPSPAEAILQAALDSLGVRYVREAFLCDQFNVDFYLPDLKAVLFCDGRGHCCPSRRKRDAYTDGILQADGFSVHRFANRDVARDATACIEGALRH